MNPIALRRHTRADLNAYWQRIGQRLRHGQVIRINPQKLVVNFVRDVRLCVMFDLSFFCACGR